MRTQQQRDRYRRLSAGMITLTIIILFSCSQMVLAQQWSTSGNDIFNSNSGKVGIGTPSPIYSLDVNGGINGFRTKASTVSAADAIATFENSSAIQMIIRGHGSVGIGTVNPGFRLDVQGGQINASGGLCIAGDCRTAWPGPSGPSQWTTTGTNIFYNTGNVGIGTNSPLALLDVRNSDGLFYAGFGYGTNKETFIRAGSSTTGVLHLGDANTTKTLLQENGGNVGIGTPSPGFRLDVQGGQINASGGLCIAGDCRTAWPTGSGSSQWTTAGTNIHYSSGNVGVGISTPVFKLDVLSSAFQIARFGSTAAANTQLLIDSPTAFNSNLTLQRGGIPKWYLGNRSSNDRFSFIEATGQTELFAILQDGRVGVGTISPTAKLHVSGDSIVTGNLTVGGLCFGSDCKTAWPPSGSSQWTTSGSNIHYTAGNVGIGNTSPLAKLHVTGVAAWGTAAFVGSSIISHFNLGGDGSEDTYIRGGKSTSRVLIGDANSGNVLLAGGGGNVGIGTTTPAVKLHVAGDGRFTGGLTVDGNIAAKYQDVAEWVPAEEQLAVGTVVVLDATKPNHVVSSNSSYDTRVAGVISEQPGITLGEKSDNKVLVATTGRVRVKVDASSGPIQIGDLLVTSNREGFAMKSLPVEIGGSSMHRPGTLIGKALEPLAKGTGEILVLLSLQ